MPSFIVTGARRSADSGDEFPQQTFNRLEIYDFIKIEEQYSLFILALRAFTIDLRSAAGSTDTIFWISGYGASARTPEAMADTPQDEPLSFFQIAGIHGLPYTPWTGTKDVDTCSESWGGYCTHSSVLFPTWHRPYVACFEQILQQHALQISDEYDIGDRKRWKEAAVALRVPYWDWALYSLPPDDVILLDEVLITTPHGRRHVHNPLKQYKFCPIDPSFRGEFGAWPASLRHPDRKTPDARSDIEDLKIRLKYSAPAIRTSTYNMLTRVDNWPAFSNRATPSQPSEKGFQMIAANSLEALHDNIHDFVGGIGHMGDTSVAAFDPIFWLHHANVDRLLSLWAALHPGIWVTEGDTPDGTYDIPPGSKVDEFTDLTPFKHSETEYWDSAHAQSCAALGYSYPEFDGLEGKPAPVVCDAIRRTVDELYGAGSKRLFQSSLVSRPKGVSGGVEGPLQVLDWTTRIRFKKFELRFGFSVLIFLGPVPEDAAQWMTAPSFVGAVSAFTNSAADKCVNCRRQTDIEIEGFVHLNEGILDNFSLDSLEQDIVAPFLKRELSWRIRKADGTPVDLSRLPSLEVDVFATVLSQPEDSQEVFPIVGLAQQIPSITASTQDGSRVLNIEKAVPSGSRWPSSCTIM